MTLNPSLCSRWQMAVPMPPMPPVTYATFCAIALLLHIRSVSTVIRGRERVKRVRPQARASLDAGQRQGSTLDRQRDAHAAADAQRRDPLAGTPALHFVQQRHQNAAARGTDGVTDRDRATV